MKLNYKNMNVNLLVEKKENYVVINIEGEVDTYTSPKVKSDILKEIEEYKNIIISMEKVKFIDSTGLGVLIGVLKKVKEKEGKMIIVSPNSYINQIFEITGLFKVFKIVNSLNEAIDELNKNN
ncbi:MAG: STAS domain-containing protein [bacterium]|nr:STAS domain-containing protein [bacterium]